MSMLFCLNLTRMDIITSLWGAYLPSLMLAIQKMSRKFRDESPKVRRKQLGSGFLRHLGCSRAASVKRRLTRFTSAS